MVEFVDYVFSAQDRDLEYLAFRRWGQPGLASVILFDNRELLGHNPENVRPGMTLRLRKELAAATTYVVGARKRLTRVGGGHVYREFAGGESVYDIAAKTLGSRYLYDKLAAANGLTPPYELSQGQVLKVPALARPGRQRLAAAAARARESGEEAA